MAERYDELLDLAREVADEAADLVRSLRRQGVVVSATKSSQVDIVTEADKAAEALIFERLMAARPGDGFLGEEGASSTSTSGITWVVDPIDGTVNFLYGIGHYAISIAARDRAQVVAGVVLNLGTGECFAAALGAGATCDGRPLRVREVVPMSERLVLTGFSYVTEVRGLQGAAVGALLGEVRDIRRLGSAALDLCAIADGRADAYVEEGPKPWDMAAGGLVATEAGARLEISPGVGGMACVICAPVGGFEEFFDVVARCGFLRVQETSSPPEVEPLTGVE